MYYLGLLHVCNIGCLLVLFYWPLLWFLCWLRRAIRLLLLLRAGSLKTFLVSHFTSLVSLSFINYAVAPNIFNKQGCYCSQKQVSRVQQSVLYLYRLVSYKCIVVILFNIVQYSHQWDTWCFLEETKYNLSITLMHFHYDRIKQNGCFIYFSGTATVPLFVTQVSKCWYQSLLAS